MRVVVTGGTGLIGRALCKALLSEGRSITVLTRRPEQAQTALSADVTVQLWDGMSKGPWESAVQNADVIVNLAGESIGGGRWTKSRKEKIISSRLHATKSLVRAMERGEETSNRRPLLINASGKDFYGDRGDEDVDEGYPQGTGFLAHVCGAWEKAAKEAEESGVAVALLRLGLVLGRGGALDQMMLPYRLFVGGTIGNGRQWVSWIHLTDVVRLILFLIEKHEENDADVGGPFNATTPNPVTMRQFGQTLGEVMGRPSWFPVPSPVLRLALGEMADLMLISQRAMPMRSEQLGFAFQYPSLKAALEDVLA